MTDNTAPTPAVPTSGVRTGFAAMAAGMLFIGAMTVYNVVVGSPHERTVAAELAATTTLTETQISCAASRISATAQKNVTNGPGPVVTLVDATAAAHDAAIASCT